MQLTPRTFKKNKIYSPSSSINERSRYSSTSESKKQIKVKTHLKRTRLAWVAYSKVTNEIKQKINICFTKNFLNSTKTKFIWKVIHCFLNPKTTTLEGNLNDKFFNSIVGRVTGKKPVKSSDIYRTITSLPEYNRAI